MKLSPYTSQRKLGAALHTDGSLVGKWLSGDVSPSPRSRAALQKLLPVPAGYFSEQARRDRLAELAVSDAATKTVLAQILADIVELRRRLERLESEHSTAPTPAKPRRRRPA